MGDVGDDALDGAGLVFILGTGRCGSTLVQEVCSRHPEVAFVSNLEDRLGALGVTSRWNNPLYRRIPASWTGKGRARFAPSEGYGALGREVSPLLVAPLRDLTADDASPWIAARLRRFVGRRLEAQGRRTFVHKFTGWPRAGLLAAVFPSARFVHVVRDGRAVANSLVQMPWWTGYQGSRFGPLSADHQAEWEASGRSFPVLAGIEWKILVDAHDQACGRLPPGRWSQVRYEDLVASPREVLEPVLDVAGLAWTPEFEAGFARHRFDPGRRQAFRSDLDGRTLDLLEQSLGPHLTRLGYG